MACIKNPLNNREIVDILNFRKGRFYGKSWDSIVTAWMPLPELYKVSENNSKEYIDDYIFYDDIFDFDDGLEDFL